MKYFLLLVLMIAVFELTLAADENAESELGKKAEQFLKKCVDLHKITQDQLRLIMRLQPITDKPSKCFLACMAKEFEFMKNDNTFDKRKITTTLKPLMDRWITDKHEDSAKKVYEIIDTCVPLQKGSGDECFAAREAYDCILENAQRLDFLSKNK